MFLRALPRQTTAYRFSPVERDRRAHYSDRGFRETGHIDVQLRREPGEDNLVAKGRQAVEFARRSSVADRLSAQRGQGHVPVFREERTRERPGKRRA